MNAEKRDFAIEVIAFVAGHYISQELFELEVPTKDELHFAAHLSMYIADLMNFRFPEAAIAAALLKIPHVQKSLVKVLGKEKVASLRPSPCASCREIEYRVRAVFPYLCSVAAGTAFDIPEGYEEPDSGTPWTGTTEALLASRFVNALKWAQDFEIFPDTPCATCNSQQTRLT